MYSVMTMHENTFSLKCTEDSTDTANFIAYIILATLRIELYKTIGTE